MPIRRWCLEAAFLLVCFLSELFADGWDQESRCRIVAGDHRIMTQVRLSLQQPLFLCTLADGHTEEINQTEVRT